MQDGSKSLKTFSDRSAEERHGEFRFPLSRVPVRHNETLDFANTGRRQMETTGNITA